MALAVVEATGMRETGRYLLPLGVKWTKYASATDDLSRVLAAVRRGPREGTLLDVAADPDFIALLLRNVIASGTVEAGGRRLEFRPTARFKALGLAEIKDVRPVSGEQSNTTALVDRNYVVKVLRRVQDGLNPEVEVGRFLTDEVDFQNAPALYGSVELVDGEHLATVAVVHAFIENQGDAWTVTNAYLDRFVEAQRLLASDDPAAGNEQAAYLLRVQQIGRQLAKLHLALASRDDIADFAPEPIARAAAAGWIDQVVAQAQSVFAELRRRSGEFKPAEQDLIGSLLGHEAALKRRLTELLPDDVAAMKIRHHGDLHLGQMLWVKDDVYILDFEGEPRRPIAERRRKAPAARDVAGVIRSIDYSVTAALERATRLQPDEGGHLTSALERWREQSSLAFWDAYRTGMTDGRLWPSDGVQTDRLLDFFLLEKAIYEIGYELANRPDWLRVPLAGTLRILAGRPEQATPQEGP
jgi:maltose alpha-D-glucosyltransferase/alpha-amylase